MKRVVITGLGCVSPLGKDIPELVEGLSTGRCAARKMEGWDSYKGLRCTIAAPAELVNEKDIPRRDRRSMSRMSIFSVQAAQEALKDAGLSVEDVPRGRMGCVVGSTVGSMIAMTQTFETILPSRNIGNMTSMQFFQIISHTAVMNIAQYLGITGNVIAPSAACASGLQAVGLGYDMIRLGRQEAILCGGSEELHPTVTGSFDVLYAATTGYNDRPEKASRPFDRDRDGLVCGEGSGILLLEEYEHAKARGAEIYAEITGFSTCGSGEHISQSSRKAMQFCMNNALAESGLSADAVDYVNAHATSTPHGDTEEAVAIREVVGGETPVSSMKGHLGHTLGAAGAIELISSLMMMEKGVLYPTLNLENVDPDCKGLDHVQQVRETQIRSILKNAFAFGGINASLVCVKI